LPAVYTSPPFGEVTTIPVAGAGVGVGVGVGLGRFAAKTLIGTRNAAIAKTISSFVFISYNVRLLRSFGKPKRRYIKLA
jgi:hypothetical protein